MDLRIITEEFPVIHINGASIDAKLYAHRTAAELDHPDGSVTWDKLGADVKETIDEKANSPHSHSAADIHMTDGEALENKILSIEGAVSEKLDETVGKSLLDAKIGNNSIGAYCLYNLVAGITSQLYVAIAYPIPGVSKYVLVVNGKQMCSVTAIGKPIKIASALSGTTKSYLCFMDINGAPMFYAYFSDNIKTTKFTAGILTYAEPDNPWIPEDEFE